MPHRFKLIQMPASREPVSLLAVDRCVSELRRGRMVCVRGGGGVSALVQAAEAVTDDGLEKLKTVAQQQPVLAITLRRALILSLIDAADQKSPAIALSCAKGWQAEAVLELADPLSNFDFEKGHSGDLDVKSAKTYGCAAAAIGLATDLDPEDDIQASARTKKHLAGVLLRRVLRQMQEPTA